jgi:hypothetical protein
MTGSVIEEQPSESGRSFVLAASLAAAITANLIHNRLGLDVAVLPAIVFAALYYRRPGRTLLWVTAFVIAFPAFSFLEFSALSSPANSWFFLNHVALLLAGTLAVTSVIWDLLSPLRNQELQRG